ncbi:MAG: NADH-quinone oxidoreductase subunit N [Candidatus Caldarchaeales archaeon]
MLTPLIIVFAFSFIPLIIRFILPKTTYHLLYNIPTSIGLLSTLVILLDLLSNGYLLANPNPVPDFLVVDRSGVFISLISVILGSFIVTYSLKFMEKDKGLSLYYSLILLNVAGIMGIAFSNDFFTFFIFWELMCVSSYLLVVFRKDYAESVEAGIKYMMMGSFSSVSILFGLTLFYAVTGTLNLYDAATILRNSNPNFLIYISLIFLLVGFGVKTAIFPLHTWLPDTYTAAPQPISAFLSGIVTVTGLYAIIRTFSILSHVIDTSFFLALSIFSVVNMFFGNIVALLQDDLRKIMAYSSIAHIGYMLIGVSLWSWSGIASSLIHLFNHAFMKSLAFLCIGVFTYRLGASKLEYVKGVGRRMPLTSIAFIISLLSLIGMPPLNGFISKLYIFIASVESGAFWLGLLLVINSSISAGYYLRVIRVLLSPTSTDTGKITEAPIQLLIPIYAATIIIILFGLWPDPILELARSAASAILGFGGVM